MERILVLLFAALFSMDALAALPAGVPVIGLGCYGTNPCTIFTTSANPEGWFAIHAGGTVTTNQFRAFIKSGTAAQYQVGGSAIVCYHVTYNGASAGARFQLASSTAADGVTAASLSAGQKYETGAAATFGHVELAAQTNYDEALAYTFSASSYPYVTSDSTAVWGITLFCK